MKQTINFGIYISVRQILELLQFLVNLCLTLSTQVSIMNGVKLCLCGLPSNLLIKQ